MGAADPKQVGRSPAGRFAPSPTGSLHLGSLVAALGSFLIAKTQGAKWMLRMEDLDTPRVVPGAADDILRTLEAFGLLWDGDVVYQSNRVEHYQAALDELLRRGAAYPCSCSRAEVARAASAPHPGEEGPVYPGTCRERANGRPVRAHRVKVVDEPIELVDHIQGPTAVNLASSIGDFVVKRADGPFAYQLAVVVDDAAAGVSQVVRGADLLSSTPRQIHLQRLLSLPTPEYFHLPLVTGPQGEKLSKRDCAVSLAHGRDRPNERGLLLTGCLRFLGQTPPPELDRAPAVDVVSWAADHFDLRSVPRNPSPLYLPYRHPRI